MQVKIKVLNEDAVDPAYSNPFDAGADLVATSVTKHDNFWEYGTGLAFEIPEGYVGKVYPRSSVSNTGAMLCNSCGIIDSSYRGEVKLRFYGRLNVMITDAPYKVGDRIGQLMVSPVLKLNFIRVIELSDTVRGAGGYGSTGA